MSKALGPHSDIKEFTSFVGDVSLTDNGDGRDYPEGASAIYNAGATGDLHCVTSTGETRIITAIPAASMVRPTPFYVVKILAATTLVKVVVGWG